MLASPSLLYSVYYYIHLLSINILVSSLIIYYLTTNHLLLIMLYQSHDVKYC